MTLWQRMTHNMSCHLDILHILVSRVEMTVIVDIGPYFEKTWPTWNSTQRMKSRTFARTVGDQRTTLVPIAALYTTATAIAKLPIGVYTRIPVTP